MATRTQALARTVACRSRPRAEHDAEAAGIATLASRALVAGQMPRRADAVLLLQRAAGNAALGALLRVQGAGQLEQRLSTPSMPVVQRCGTERHPGCACMQTAPEEEQQQHAAAVQRTIGDGHDLHAPRFTQPARDEDLEACFDDEARLTMGGRGQPGTTKVGSGPAVRAVQQALVELGYLPTGAATGTYDQLTWNAVKKLKKDKGLGWEVMGDIGPGTMAWLDGHFAPAPTPNVTCPPCPEDPRTAGCPPCSSPSPSPPIPVFVCAKPLATSPVGNHAFFRFGAATAGNPTMELEPEEIRPGCFQGVPQRDFPEDFSSSTTNCLPVSSTKAAIDGEFAAYPQGHYCTFGPNSNSFVGHLLRRTGAGSVRPSGWLPGFDEGPPPAGTFAPSPTSTLTGCTTSDCPSPEQSRERARLAQMDCVKDMGGCGIPGGVPTPEDLHRWNAECEGHTGYDGPDIIPTPEDCAGHGSATE
jgi:hypothetical protein